MQESVVEKQRARTLLKLARQGRLPGLPLQNRLSGDADMELMVAVKRLMCLDFCLDVELLWMNSAWAMYQTFRPPQTHEVVPWFPEGNYWIEFETPKQTPAGTAAALLLIDRSENTLQAISELYFEQAARSGPGIPFDATTIQTKVKDIEKRKEVLPASQGSNLYEVSVVDARGAITWSVQMKLFIELGSIGWEHTWGHRCQTGACDLLEKELGENAPGCLQCQSTFEFFQEWLGIAHSMLRGDFRETAQTSTEPESILVTEEIKQPDLAHSPKKHVEHRMYVIRFDASMKRLPPESQNKRGAWMSGRPIVEDAYEADEKAVIFVQMQFNAHTRTFRHERYKAARDTIRSFPSHVHPQPMTVHEYKARREAGEVSDDGIFRAKQPHQPRRIQVEASLYQPKPRESHD